MWGLKKKVDELEALVQDRCNSLEEGLKRVIARGEIVEILKGQLTELRIEKKELLDRVMARDFETLQTYTRGGEEEKEEELRPEEDEAMAGEVFSVGN